MRDRIGEKQLGIDPLEGVAPAHPRILSTERSKVDRKRRPDGFQPGYFSGLLRRLSRNPPAPGRKITS